MLYNYESSYQVHPENTLNYGLFPAQPIVYIIIITVSKSRQRPMSAAPTTITSFKVNEGNSWSETLSWDLTETYWPVITVKKYSYFYNESTNTADPYVYVSFQSPARYLTGSSINYDDLRNNLKEAFDAVLELAHIPLTSVVNFIFDKLGSNSPLINGVDTDNLTVSLRTGSSFGANYGIIIDNLKVDGLANWVSHHPVGYMDQIDFDARYTVEAGYCSSLSTGTYSKFLGYTSVTKDRPTMSKVDVVLVVTK